MSSLVTIEYIGRRPRWKDSIYGTGLDFESGQVRTVPFDLAKKFLRHVDLFAESPVSEDPKPKDDTEHLLESARKEAEAKENRQLDFEVIDRINQMDKAMLEKFASERFSINLDKRKSIEKLREEVIGHVDRFGAL